MSIMKQLADEYTNFTVTGRYIVLWYSEDCDRCGRECQGPNPLQVASGLRVSELVLAGFFHRMDMPGELCCTDSGDCVCEQCYDQIGLPACQWCAQERTSTLHESTGMIMCSHCREDFDQEVL